MFSRFKFRSDVSESSGKRPYDEESETSLEPPEKIQRYELDEEDENSVVLPEELVAFVSKYTKKHISDKVIKEKILSNTPVPSNVPVPPALDIYIKDLINESVNKSKVNRVDGFFGQYTTSC